MSDIAGLVIVRCDATNPKGERGDGTKNPGSASGHSCSPCDPNHPDHEQVGQGRRSRERARQGRVRKKAASEPVRGECAKK